jgi:hypothetical protein
MIYSLEFGNSRNREGENNFDLNITFARTIEKMFLLTLRTH